MANCVIYAMDCVVMCIGPKNGREIRVHKGNNNPRVSLFIGIVFTKYFCELMCLVE